jgi:hypothetical protein
VVASVASWSGRKSVGFSDVAGESGRGEGVTVHGKAGRGCQRARGTVPCRRA